MNKLVDNTKRGSLAQGFEGGKYPGSAFNTSGKGAGLTTFKTLGDGAGASENKLNALLDFNGMKTDKHMRDSEALMHSRYYETADKTLKSGSVKDRNGYKATLGRSKFDVDNEFLLEGEGNVPGSLVDPIKTFSANADAHYKYNLLQIQNDLKAQKSTFSAAEQRLFNQIEELRNQRHIEKAEFYEQIEHYKKILGMRH